MLLFATALLVLPFSPQADDGPAFLEPSPEAATATPFWSKSKGELRYIWRLPEGYSKDEPRDMTIVLHGTGGDYRWGLWNNFNDRHMASNPLRADDILISVDGTSPGNNDTRLFLGGKDDVDGFHDFLVEMREKFAVDKIFLYGHSQGAFFVVLFASEHPEMLGGVVAHAGGVWNGVKIGRKMKDCPVLFLHGTADPVVTFRNSVGGRDHMVEKGMDLVALLRMPGYNHWPNSMRVTEGIDWCEGMVSTDPANVLHLAEQLAKHKGPDSYQYEISPALSLSFQVAQRLVGEGDRALEEVPGSVSKGAKKLISAIDKQGKAVVKKLSKGVGKKVELKEDMPLGLLVAAREDYRGVPSIEAYYKGIGYDKLLKKQQKKAEKIHSVWWNSKKPEEIFATTVDLIDEAFLIEGFAFNMKVKMEEWQGSAKSLGIDDKTLAKYEQFELWIDG